LYKEVQAANPDDLVNGLQTVLRGYEKEKRWPSDEDFRKKIITKSLYTSKNSDRIKLVLESLNSTLSKETVDPGNLTIEHIMPQTLTPEWEQMLGNNSSQVKKELLHTLGNLTLTGYNREMANKPFDYKKGWYRDSNVSLNKYFEEIVAWNADEIKARADKLADIAIKLWPR
jgi:hypothetical protein